MCHTHIKSLNNSEVSFNIPPFTLHSQGSVCKAQTKYHNIATQLIVPLCIKTLQSLICTSPGAEFCGECLFNFLLSWVSVVISLTSAVIGIHDLRLSIAVKRILLHYDIWIIKLHLQYYTTSDNNHTSLQKYQLHERLSIIHSITTQYSVVL